MIDLKQIQLQEADIRYENGMCGKRHTFHMNICWNIGRSKCNSKINNNSPIMPYSSTPGSFTKVLWLMPQNKQDTWRDVYAEREESCENSTTFYFYTLCSGVSF